MLPARSKRYVGLDGSISRERLAGPWQLLLVLIISVLLFYVVYPRRTLVGRLYDQHDLDDLSLSYVQNLLRADPHNADAALLMARQRSDELAPRELQALVDPYLDAADPRRRLLAEEMELHALERELAGSEQGKSPDADVAARLRRILEGIVERPDLDPQRARRYAWLASQANLQDLAEQLIRIALAGASAAELEQAGLEAERDGQIPLAQYLFLLACDRSTEPVGQLRRLQRGTRSTLAQGQPAQALRLAQKHLGPLRDDRAALRWMTRLALSAGEPQQAAEYARDLVFQPPAPSLAGRP